MTLMIAVDIVIEITYNLKDPDKSIIKTNAKKEMLEELLCDWLREEVGQGKDKSEPNVMGEYQIKIGLSLAEDTFCIESNAGNKSLTCGLVMNVMKKLDKLHILPLDR